MKKSDIHRIIKEEISRVIADGLLDNNFKFNKIYEVMVPSHRDDYYEIGETNYMVIAQDDVTNDYLVLFTELHKENNYYTYSYFFVVFGDDRRAKTPRMYTRESADIYLPKEIKPNIIPLVLKMTKALISRITPTTIKRQAVEHLTDKGMIRYEAISQLLQDELGYKLIHQGKDDENKHIWTFIKDNKTVNMDENTILSYYIPSAQQHREVLERAHENLLKAIEKNPLKLD
jgi:hypothetical protein